MRTLNDVRHKLTRVMFKKNKDLDSAVYYQGVIHTLEWVLERRKQL